MQECFKVVAIGKRMNWEKDDGYESLQRHINFGKWEKS